MSGNNHVGPGVYEDPRRGFEIFDQLPPEIRRIVAYAPYNFAVYAGGGAISGLLKSGRSAREIVEIIFQHRDARIQATYGPDHPMIGSRIPERRPERRLAL